MSSTAARPELARVLDHLRESDTLAVWRLDRLGRSLRRLVDTVSGLAERDARLAKLATMPEDADADILVLRVPRLPRRKLRSSHPLERFNNRSSGTASSAWAAPAMLALTKSLRARDDASPNRRPASSSSAHSRRLLKTTTRARRTQPHGPTKYPARPVRWPSMAVGCGSSSAL